MKKITTSLVLLALSGSSLRAEAFRKVQEEVIERTGADVRWEKEMASREETSAIVQKLLKKPLTVSSAVQIALLNNRGLQETFEEVGIARADVIEAVTLPNPSVDFEVQFPPRCWNTQSLPVAGCSGVCSDPYDSPEEETLRGAA
jgi:hypothetical protein